MQNVPTILHTFHIFQREGDMMKMRDMILMAMGAGAVLAYQKYNKPMMKKVEKVADKAMQKASDKLEDMMQKRPPKMEAFLENR